MEHLCASELDNHVLHVTPQMAEASLEHLFDGGWAFAADKESVDSFLHRLSPSRSRGVAWISAEHNGRSTLEKHYEGDHRRMQEIEDEWEAEQNKSLDTLWRVLEAHQYGCGKWMVSCPKNRVDTVWRRIVAALWAGQLGSSSKCSGANQNLRDTSHVICVYVNPFWDHEEMLRVLRALREKCGVDGTS